MANGEGAQAYYVHTLSSLGFLGKRVSNGIIYDDLKNNRTMFAWTLIDDTDEDDDADCFHLKQKGSLEIIVRFKTVTTSTISAQVFDRREDPVYHNLKVTTRSVESIV